MSAPSEANGILEHLLFEIAAGVSGQTGAAFFHSLVRHLAGSLEADFVLLGVLQPGDDRIVTLAAFGDGADIPTVEYVLDGTPCADTIEKHLCCYPRDRMLSQMNAEGYVGSAMVDSTRRPVGLVCAITRRPLKHVKVAETLLHLVAIHAFTELERKNFEDALAESEKRLRALVTHGIEAVVRIEFERPISLDLPEDEQIELIYRHGYVADCNAQAAKLFGRSSAEDLIGTRIEALSPLSDPEQIERLRTGIRLGWQFSQVERIINGRNFLFTRQGEVEHGKLAGGGLRFATSTSSPT